MTFLQTFVDYLKGCIADAPQLTVALILFVILLAGRVLILGNSIGKDKRF